MNNPYKYVGLPLTPLMAQELILELFDGQAAGKEEIAGTVEETHLKRGGNPPRSVQHPITRALTLLKKTGLAENPIPGFWSIRSNKSEGVGKD